jgi:hypothetical protein
MDTSQWNPVTYALVLNRPVLLSYILSNAIRLDELLALGLKTRGSQNNTRHSKAELINCQLETLVLMLENKSEHITTVFN